MILPQKFKERMRDMLGDEYDDFERSLTDGEILSGIRINTLRNGAREAVLCETGELESVPWCKDGYYADRTRISGTHPYHLAGLIYFQEPSAMCPAEALPVGEGDRVLDLCAAPGGKSAQLGARMKNSGILVSNEIVRSRAEILSSNIERMGITNAIVTNESPDRLAKKYPGFFDKIMVDAPCSGEGMFRKEPRALTEWSYEHTVSCGERQKNILASAIEMLRQGGYLMYSTCTFAPEENEMTAEWLTEQGMEICDMPQLSMLSPAYAPCGGAISKARRIYPHRQRGEGHFAALFKKQGEAQGTVIAEKRIRDAGADSAMQLYRDLEKDILNVRLEGRGVLLGDRLYLKPEGIDTGKLRMLRCGLWLGTVKKNRFEPSHSLALAMSADKLRSFIDLDINDERLARYLRGETIPCSVSGWCAVCVNGYPVGWGKGSGGVLKNHYPKGLRLRSV